jgi:DNA-binding CsgD family transcriptional regulator
MTSDLQALGIALVTPAQLAARRREKRVEKLSRAGKTVAQIAQKLGVSIDTISRDRRALGLARRRTVRT